MTSSLSETPSSSGLSARVAEWSIGHRAVVVIVWLALLAGGGFAAARSGDRLSYTFDLPGQPAYETNTDIVRTFGSGGDNPPLVAVVTLPTGTTVDSSGVRSQLAALDARTAASLPGARTASWASTGDRGFVSADGRTTFSLLYPVADVNSADPYARSVPALEEAVAGQRIAGAPVRVTGSSILASGGSSGGNSVLVETLLAGVAALVVLAVAFGSLVALLPLVIAAVAIPTTFLGVYGFTYVTTMSTLVQNIIALIGLGVAIDYALLIVTRWREERAAGLANRDAVLKSASTAGSAVLFSGITVTVSLAALAITPVPFLRSIGLAGLLIPLISIAVATTLLPVVLVTVGPRLEWPRRRPPSTVSRFWTAVARLVVRRRVVATVGSLVVLGVLIAPVVGLRLGEPQAAATAATAPAQAREGLAALTSSGIGTGVLRPTEVLAPANTPNVADGPDFAPSRGITTIAPASWTRGGHQVRDAWSRADPSSAAGAADLDRIRRAAAAIPRARVGGTAAQDADLITALYGPNLLVIVAAIVVVTFVLLARALRSLWLPVKALALNVISLAAAFGVLAFVWQEGHGAQTLFSSPPTGAVTVWVPLAVFALLFGLSMDYEVFILTRVNEEYEEAGLRGEGTDGRAVDAAVVAGIGHTGRLVSSGALILCLAFVALGGVPVVDVKILSTGLAAGIIIDATIIRGVLAPALVALLGHLNWWMPAPVARLLRITPMKTSPMVTAPVRTSATMTS